MTLLLYKRNEKNIHAGRKRLIIHRALWYNGTITIGRVILMMGVIAGIIVCAFVYVIRETLMNAEEDA